MNLFCARPSRKFRSSNTDAPARASQVGCLYNVFRSDARAEEKILRSALGSRLIYTLLELLLRYDLRDPLTFPFSACPWIHPSLQGFPFCLHPSRLEEVTPLSCRSMSLTCVPTLHCVPIGAFFFSSGHMMLPRRMRPFCVSAGDSYRTTDPVS